MQWCEAMLCPLHKQGPVNNVENFRGISLLSVIGKLFTMIINQRFVKWAEANNVQHEEQAGYRKKYSTIDQIFNLQALIQKYLSKKKGRFYVLFIYFSKAFDTIPHSLLWYKLIKTGVHGKVLTVLQSMYSQLKSCVRTPAGLTEYFDCTIGTRQGCMLSPFLFTLYIGELVDQMRGAGCQGIYVNEDVSNVFMLMYADDIATCADTKPRLQNMIDQVFEYCRHWGMKVYLLKTKILVFRRGGIVNKFENWTFGGNPIEIVNRYKYLGMFFTVKLNWSLAKNTLAMQAKKALNMLRRYTYKCGVLPGNIACELFDKMVLPIVTYGSEIWGHEYSETIESVQYNFCRHILGLNSNAHKDALLGETGRHPLAVYYHCRCVRYWLKIVQLPSNRFPNACYRMLFNLDTSGRQTWATSVKKLLCKFGFNHVWAQQGAGNEELFLNVFKLRVTEHYKSAWSTSVRNSSKLAIYSTFKDDLVCEKYLNVLSIRKYIVALSRFRCSNHSLAIETGRLRYIDG